MRSPLGWLPLILAGGCVSWPCPPGSLQSEDGACWAACPEGSLRDNDGACIRIEDEDPAEDSDTPVEDSGDTGESALPGLDARPVNTSCVAPDRPALAADVDVDAVNAFPNLLFDNITRLQKRPTDNHWIVLEKDGRMLTFEDDSTTSTVSTMADLSDRVLEDGEQGLLGLIFHPEFETNRQAFVYYITPTTNPDLRGHAVLSRFTSPDGLTLDPDSEEVLLFIDQVSKHHKGGAMRFGTDGYLYLSLGDAGRIYEDGRDETAQDLSLLMGSILRLDVDNGTPYAIPPDNPFVNTTGVRPEIWAYGFRNPWTMDFDPNTGELIVADVGRTDREEVTLALEGQNHGWPMLEGTLCFLSGRIPCDDPSLIAPQWDYGHDTGVAVLGGGVYQGSLFPELQGHYIFADMLFKIWAMRDPVTNPSVELIYEPADNGGVRGFGVDEDGELLYFHKQEIWRLTRGVEAPAGTPFPETLSVTGCVDPLDPTEPSPGLIPYSVQFPLWSDGATKDRWMAIPNGEQVDVLPSGDLEFPNGTVLIKNFHRAGRFVETRLLVRHEDGAWAGYTYEWREDQSDADLLVSGKTVDVEGEVHVFPSRFECTTCHTRAANYTLGAELLQLHRDHDYESTGRTANQLDTLAAIGILSLPLDTERLSALPTPDDTTVDIETRARAYMHVNCSNCHRPDGGGAGPADYRFVPDGDIGDWNACGVEPSLGDFGIEEAMLIAPGDPDSSVVSVRMHATNSDRMPPIGSVVPDVSGVSLVDGAILALDECP